VRIKHFSIRLVLLKLLDCLEGLSAIAFIKVGIVCEERYRVIEISAKRARIRKPEVAKTRQAASPSLSSLQTWPWTATITYACQLTLEKLHISSI
jgi:hypothetical protein